MARRHRVLANVFGLLLASLLLVPGGHAAADVPGASVTRGEAATAVWQFAGMPARPAENHGFPDVTSRTPHSQDIAWLAASGVTVGRSDGTFGPNEPLMRAAFASMLYRLAGSPDGPFPPAPFVDISPDSAHFSAINWLYATGLTSGRTAQHFAPSMALTVHQMEQFFQRFTETPDVTVSVPQIAVAPQPLPAFRLAANGVTVICPDAALGDSGVVNGITFTKRNFTDTVHRITATNADTSCTSAVSDMSSLLAVAPAPNKGFPNQFDADISHWDTSSVTTMRHMFSNANMFNQDISQWDTSNVADMGWMFNLAQAFDQPIGAWDTSNVTDMEYMFFRASAFDQPIGAWDTSKVTSMRHMFHGATVFDQPIDQWNTAQVITMRNMFMQAKEFDQPIGSWVVSNVTDMERMFWDAAEFNQNIGGWDTSAVTTMERMFERAAAFDQNIGAWDTSAVASMAYMFKDAAAFNQNLSGWCVSQITANPTEFDAGATAWLLAHSRPAWGVTCLRFELAANQVTVLCPDAQLGETGVVNGITYTKRNFTDTTHKITAANASHSCTSGVTNMAQLIGTGGKGFPTDFDADISHWDTTDVTTFNLMFFGASAFNQNIGFWNTTNVTDTRGMFQNAAAFNHNIGDWDTSNVTLMGSMFRGAEAFNQNIGGWDTAEVTDMGNMFRDAALFNQDLSGWCVDKITGVPGGFMTGVNDWHLPKPVWGTCPN